MRGSEGVMACSRSFLWTGSLSAPVPLPPPLPQPCLEEPEEEVELRMASQTSLVATNWEGETGGVAGARRSVHQARQLL